MKLTNTSSARPASGASLAVASTNEIRPAKPAVDIPSGWLWLWMGLIVAALLAAGLAAWRWWRKKSSTLAAVPRVPPHLRARQRLEEALRHIDDARLFCIEVSDALRVYLEERFELRAPERTTEEFLQDLRHTTHLNVEQKESLSDFLERCDLVKFARFEPTEAALRDLQESALRLVDETKFDPVAAAPGLPEEKSTA